MVPVSSEDYGLPFLVSYQGCRLIPSGKHMIAFLFSQMLLVKFYSNIAFWSGGKFIDSKICHSLTTLKEGLKTFNIHLGTTITLSED
jgi:hypothetical protein